jgi:Protein tyrosine and serine/threonine kinase
MGAREVMRRVREGYRLERPQHCRSELFRVVGSCWLSEPYHRPDFAQLRQELRRLRDEGAECPGGGHVDLQSAIPPPSPASTLPPNSAGPHLSDHGAI